MATKDDSRFQTLVEHLGLLLHSNTERDKFYQIMGSPMPPALRLNPLQPASRSLLPAIQSYGGEKVPWCSDAFALPDFETPLGHTLEYLLGGYYIQAQAPTLAVDVLDPQPAELVLDMCASPGGKTTQIAARMKNTGLLVANELKKVRLPALVGNLERCGISNTVISNTPGTLMPRYFHNFFHRILLDAPCSGDGTLRKESSVLDSWSSERVNHWAAKQTGLLRAAFHMLRPGGVLVYSTCSLSLKENEDVILALLKRYGETAEILPIDCDQGQPLHSSIISNYPPSLSHGVRVWPHHYNTEGAFVARIGKKHVTQWSSIEADASTWQIKTGHDAEADRATHQLETEWKFRLPCPEDQVLIKNKDYLSMEPALAAVFKKHYPYYLRGGMRVARCHKEHYYLTQQASTMWGEQMGGPSIELNWLQVQDLFRGKQICFSKPTGKRGIVLCRFGPLTLCRGYLHEDGRRVDGMVPKALYRTDVKRLFSE